MQLPEHVEIEPGLDVSELAARFEVFEALHDGLDIATPMSSADVDCVVEAIVASDGERALDLACGTGALLHRLRVRADVETVGVDLSPWMIDRAARRDASSTAVRWILGDAKSQIAKIGEADVVACLGASWVWLGPVGTLTAMGRTLQPGGRLVFGDMLRRDHLAADERPSIPSAAELVAHLDRMGLDVVTTVTTSDERWDRYVEETMAAHARWRARQDVDPERHDAALEEWVESQRHDRATLGWTVIVGIRR